MLIGIEASRANRLQKTGVEWYAYHLIQELKKLPEAALHSWLLYTREPLAGGLEYMPAEWHEARLSWPLRYLWTQARVSWEMRRHPPDVLFVPAHVLPRIIPKRTVVTIHDIGFHRFPELYEGFHSLPQVKTSAPRRFHEWSTLDIVKRASRILTVSEFSKREIVEFYRADPSKIFVSYLGVDHDRYTPRPPEIVMSVLDRLRIPAPYLLFVGRLEAKKNVGTLLEAFSRYKELRGVGDPLQLVLMGKPGMGYEAIDAVLKKIREPEAVHVIGYATEEDKIALFSGAEALVHPSWYEGFGLTPIEAMACGCPVICSHAGSLPEVVGMENALWFDPMDTDALVRALAHLIDDPSVREELQVRGLTWAKRYQWQKTAQDIFPLLTEW